MDGTEMTTKIVRFSGICRTNSDELAVLDDYGSI